MRLFVFAFLTTSLLAASYRVTPDIEYSAPGGESLGVLYADTITLTGSATPIA